jgi:hypothetical protein
LATKTLLNTRLSTMDSPSLSGLLRKFFCFP